MFCKKIKNNHYVIQKVKYDVNGLIAFKYIILKNSIKINEFTNLNYAEEILSKLVEQEKESNKIIFQNQKFRIKTLINYQNILTYNIYKKNIFGFWFPVKTPDEFMVTIYKELIYTNLSFYSLEDAKKYINNQIDFKR